MKVCVATDLLALTMMEPPSTWGADIVIGSAQRFGVPMGYGGPHAAFLSCSEEYKRLLPGRIIGMPSLFIAKILQNAWHNASARCLAVLSARLVPARIIVDGTPRQGQ